MDFPKKAVTWLWEGSESKEQRESVASTFQQKPSKKVWLVLDAPRKARLSGVFSGRPRKGLDLHGFLQGRPGFLQGRPREGPDLHWFLQGRPREGPDLYGFLQGRPREGPDLHWFLQGRPREGPVKHREGPEKAPTYIGFYREGPAHPVWALQK